MVAMAPPLTEVEDPPRLPMPSRNPLPLSSSQEAQVRELYHARVRGYCAAEIKGLYPLNPSNSHAKFSMSSLRRLRPRENLHRTLQLPGAEPRHEQLHGKTCNTRRARCRTRRMVRIQIKETDGTGSERGEEEGAREVS